MIHFRESSSLNTDLVESSVPFLVSGMKGKNQYFSKYDFIYDNSFSGRKLYLIREGLVRLGFQSEKCKEITYCLLGEGSIVGNFWHAPQKYNFAQAYTNVQVLVFSEWEIKSLFQRDSSSAFELFKWMGQYMQSIEEHFKIIASCDVHQRMIRFILYLADLYGYRHQRITFIPHHFTHEDMSRIIHASRQTVTMTLRKLQQQGYLSYGREEFRIFRYDELAECIR